MSENTLSSPNRDGFDPLALAPPKARKRYARLAERARTQARAATKLGCIECCCWDYAEAKRCEINTCSHWSVNRLIFKAKPTP